MKHGLALLAFAASTCVLAAPPERPNQPVFRSGPWFVVRSVRDGGSVVACTGFYRANGRVQLSRDALIIKTSEEIQGVAFSFGDGGAGPQRPLTAAEKDLKAIVFAGEDFDKLAQSPSVRIDAATAQGVVRHELQLPGFTSALENIRQGCPVPAAPQTAPVRKRHRS